MLNLRKIAILLTMASPLCGGDAFSSGRPVDVDALVKGDDNGAKSPAKSPAKTPPLAPRKNSSDVVAELRVKLGTPPAKRPSKPDSSDAASPVPGHVRVASASGKSMGGGNEEGGLQSPTGKPPAKTPPPPSRKQTPPNLSPRSLAAAALQEKLGPPPAKRASNSRSSSADLNALKTDPVMQPVQRQSTSSKPVYEPVDALALATTLGANGGEIPAEILDLAGRQLQSQASPAPALQPVGAANANGMPVSLSPGQGVAEKTPGKGQGDGAKKQ